eukprot:TRINITY_DN9523_c0_g1_i1.p1 TRINITY_DN9523_c0_g1~~TRINITY_DN9523_c0_g1_i1.p1  ORF type:complete len:757 (+),score=232.88 TRINITY_DN9523_c0_g1_i1:55-2325(+)
MWRALPVLLAVREVSGSDWVVTQSTDCSARYTSKLDETVFTTVRDCERSCESNAGCSVALIRCGTSCWLLSDCGVQEPSSCGSDLLQRPGPPPPSPPPAPPAPPQPPPCPPSPPPPVPPSAAPRIPPSAAPRSAPTAAPEAGPETAQPSVSAAPSLSAAPSWPDPEVATLVLGGRQGSAAVGAGVAGASGGSAASQLAALVLLSEARCDDSSEPEDSVLNPLELELLSSVHLGAVVGNILVVVCTTALHFLALLVCSTFSPPMLRAVRIAPQDAVVRSMKEVATTVRFPGAQLLVATMLYSGTVYSAWKAVFADGAAAAVCGAAFGLGLVGVGVPLAAYTVFTKMLRGEANYEREKNSGNCRRFWMGSGDWVAARDGWYWRWGTAMRATSSTRNGLWYQVFSMVGLTAVALLVALPKRSTAWCGVTQAAIASIFYGQAAAASILLPYCRRRDRVHDSLYGALLGTASLSRMVGHFQGKAGDAGDTSAPFAMAGRVLAAAAALLIARAFGDAATELYSIGTRRRAALQRQHHAREGFWGDGLPRLGEELVRGMTDDTLGVTCQEREVPLERTGTLDTPDLVPRPRKKRGVQKVSSTMSGRPPPRIPGRGRRPRVFTAAPPKLPRLLSVAETDSPGTPPDTASAGGSGDAFVSFGGREFIRPGGIAAPLGRGLAPLGRARRITDGRSSGPRTPMRRLAPRELTSNASSPQPSDEEDDRSLASPISPTAFGLHHASSGKSSMRAGSQRTMASLVTRRVD